MTVRCYFCKTPMDAKKPEKGMVWACSDCCDNHGIMPGAFEGNENASGRSSDDQGETENGSRKEGA